jgi:hypothetical protein
MLRIAKSINLFVEEAELSQIRADHESLGGTSFETILDRKRKRLWRIGQVANYGEDFYAFYEHLLHLATLIPHLDIRPIGLRDVQGSPAPVYTMTYIEGTKPSMIEITEHLNRAGWTCCPQNEFTFVNEIGMRMQRASANNFLRTHSGELVPIDVDISMPSTWPPSWTTEWTIETQGTTR